MVKIIDESGRMLARTERVTYIRRAENGCFALCDRAQAAGVAIGGTAYRLHDCELPGAVAAVRLEECDAGDEITGVDDRAAAIENDLQTADEAAIELYENLLAKDTVDAAQDEALIELYETIGG